MRHFFDPSIARRFSAPAPAPKRKRKSPMFYTFWDDFREFALGAALGCGWVVLAYGLCLGAAEVMKWFH